MIDEKKINEILYKHIGADLATTENLKTMLGEAYSAGCETTGQNKIYMSNDTLDVLDYARKISALIEDNTGVNGVLITGKSVEFQQDDGKTVIQFRT